ncbi:MAG: FAD-binding protein [Polyangiaceae bacterium]
MHQETRQSETSRSATSVHPDSAAQQSSPGAGAVDVSALSPDESGYWHPRSEAEIQALVRHARARGLQVRVRGAAHSVPAAIHTDARLRAGAGLAPRADQALEMVLDLHAAVVFDDARRRVTVQAGCRFGADPHDRTGRASLAAGLCAQLEARGWALPNLAGVTT